MSNPTPPQPLDYESPPPEKKGFAVGTFVGSFIVWAIASPFLVVAAWGASVTIKPPLGPIAGVGGFIAIIAVTFFAVWKTRSARVRRGAMAGTLGGMGVGLLLMGLCFAAFNGH